MLPRSIGRIRALASEPSASVSLGSLMKTVSAEPTNLISAARWLHKEIPIRLARRIDDFLHLPYAAVCNDHFQVVLKRYVSQFEAITRFPDIQTDLDERDFRELIRQQFFPPSCADTVTRKLSQGHWEVRRMYPDLRIHAFLDRLFVGRIATRNIAENYLEMHAPREGYVGVVQQNLLPHGTVAGLIEPLTRITRGVYGFSPSVTCAGNLDCTLDYIPLHVRYMVQEVMKNALRATAERHGPIDTPPVSVEIQKGDVHVLIKISDQGGGIPQHLQQHVWEYGWTTAGDGDGHEVLRKNLAGFGFGLPLTRLYAQFFGGDIAFHTLAGHGTDVHLLLNHLVSGRPSTENEDAFDRLLQEDDRLSSLKSARVGSSSRLVCSSAMSYC